MFYMSSFSRDPIFNSYNAYYRDIERKILTLYRNVWYRDMKENDFVDLVGRVHTSNLLSKGHCRFFESVMKYYDGDYNEFKANKAMFHSEFKFNIGCDKNKKECLKYTRKALYIAVKLYKSVDCVLKAYEIQNMIRNAEDLMCKRIYGLEYVILMLRDAVQFTKQEFY
jgi:hypothetical protein